MWNNARFCLFWLIDGLQSKYHASMERQYRQPLRRTKKFIDLTGKVYGRLTVVEFLGIHNNSPYWKCACSCGSHKEIMASSIMRGLTQSCGCLAIDVATQHGDSHSPEYEAWAKLKFRCSSSKGEYSRWSGRGIRVCERWQDSFDNFLADMGRRPSPDHSIDRIDNNSGYEPGNCRWATREEQQNNRSSVVLYEWNGRRLSLAAWSRETGISVYALRERAKRGIAGAALFVPSRQRAKSGHIPHLNSTKRAST